MSTTTPSPSRNSDPRFCHCGDPKAWGHYFDSNLKCWHCGRSFAAHQRNPRRCPNPKVRVPSTTGSGRSRLPPWKRKLIRKLWRGGWTVRAIRDRLKCDDKTIARYRGER